MKRTPIVPDLNHFPVEFHPLLSSGQVYDSSCSPVARVYYIDKDQGYFLKTSDMGTLKKEAELTRFFHEKRLAAQVVSYLTTDRDWMLTTRVPGEDCTHADYLAQPEQLCDTTATLLRQLHELDPAGCPVPDHTAQYLALAEHNYRTGKYDASLFPDNWGYATPEEAWHRIETDGHLLRTDTLLHGDYCLPNIILNHGQFSGLIDLGNGGIGDRHVDLFWGIWTLFFNLKTNRYADRFLDAYGRWDVEPEILRLISAIEVFG